MASSQLKKKESFHLPPLNIPKINLSCDDEAPLSAKRTQDGSISARGPAKSAARHYQPYGEEVSPNKFGSSRSKSFGATVVEPPSSSLFAWSEGHTKPTPSIGMPYSPYHEDLRTPRGVGRLVPLTPRSIASSDGMKKTHNTLTTNLVQMTMGHVLDIHPVEEKPLPYSLLQFDIEHLCAMRDYFRGLTAHKRVSSEEWRAGYSKNGISRLYGKSNDSVDTPDAQTLFNRMDTKKRGYISFRDLVISFHPSASTQELKDIEDWAFPHSDRPNLNDEQIAEIEQTWHYYDYNNLGSITLTQFITNNLSQLPREELRRVFHQMDTNGDGVISLNDYMEGMDTMYLDALIKSRQ
ncbi:hypothetical protein PROFUN_00144 [Planoprotostelium fungivorum]|uniref:EF-hand domain-containing protein n=1 Tax=Planoprotostelium fungivorum TaxID=1890364 RepID=A0A2P6P0R3_9EUKA|nr:hypothetical protein PROFUN_00144 [Planoprotostelium fungivorum]